MSSGELFNVDAQFTKAVAELTGIPFVELFLYPIDRSAISMISPHPFVLAAVIQR